MIFKFDKSIFSKIMFLINIIIGFLHSICFLFNNFYLEYFSNFSLISVFFPVIYALNLFFLLYWLVKLDYRFIFSSIFFAETLKSVVISLFTTTGTPSAISTIAE